MNCLMRFTQLVGALNRARRDNVAAIFRGGVKMTRHVVPAAVIASLLVMTGMHASQTPAPRNLPYTAVHDPQFISAADATFMNHDDRVIGLMAGNVAKAYPAGI